MADRDGDYVLVRNRKSKKSRQYYYDDDDDDDDDDQYYRRANRRKPRNRYFSSDDIDSDSRRQPSDPRIRIRRTNNGERVIVDEDDNVIKVMRDARSPSPITPEQRRRLRHRPRESQSFFYEAPDGHVVSRPTKRSLLHTKKTQVVYADDEPTKVIKRVIIDPRTGDRETIYEKDKPKRQQKYYLRQQPAQVLYESDESDDQQPTQYARVVKRRPAPPEIAPRQEPPTRYVMIKKRAESDPMYAVTSRMPVIKNTRRVVYEVPSKKPLTTYIYPNGKYYK